MDDSDTAAQSNLKSAVSNISVYCLEVHLSVRRFLSVRKEEIRIGPPEISLSTF